MAKRYNYISSNPGNMMGKMRDLVQERFEAIAHKALLQGLNESAPKKAVNVEGMIEQVPEHWTQPRFKYIAVVRSWKTEKDWQETAKHDRQIYGHHPVPVEQERWDILVTRRGMKAKLTYEGEKPDSLLLVELFQNQDKNFWRFYLNSHFPQSWLTREIVMTQSLNVEVFRNLPVFSPPLEEQQAIAQYLTVEETRKNRFLELY